ncbi:carbon-nitrogen family hydrolase [Paenibacillus sp. IB182496]|uniref:Carbon-nitrogen family hydrolase n=2 Tax=Paenibacillus sabuli TaxID=2772509 RepID=A0A927BSX9_9BACL|nr:carbon-nitrogen family hydrolase [Paenibacillus sabuli]MBD2845095.1 carbon-nitrogen family hydrolase [Paenibacillus sabuli]
MDEPSRPLHVALLQMNIKAGDPDANFRRLGELLEEAVAGDPKPDIVMFPEMWNTGYALDRIEELADPQGKRTLALLGEYARKHQVHLLAGSIAERRDDGVYNTAYVLDRAGAVRASYSKIHLFRLMEEEKHLQAGDRPGTLELDGIAAGMMICYDIRFPELARRLALGGARMLFVPAEWPNPRLHHWRTLLTARAIENQMYVIACNRTGTSGATSFFGHSMIIDPWGEVVAEAGEAETVLRAVVDPALTEEVRGRIPVFEDRRPALY